MNEIEKMYENAGIAPDCEHGECGLDYCPNNYGCGYAFYPPFTTEKQLELIKEIVPGYPLYYNSGDYDNFSFEEGLACRINRHWEHWNDKQKQQIKEILDK